MGLFEALDFLQRKLKEYNINFSSSDTPDGSKIIELNVKDNKMKMKIDPDKKFDHLTIDWHKLDDPDINIAVDNIRSMITGEVPADYDYHGVRSCGSESELGGISVVGVFANVDDFEILANTVNDANEYISHYLQKENIVYRFGKDTPDILIGTDVSDVWHLYLIHRVRYADFDIGPEKFPVRVFVLNLNASTWNILMKSFSDREELAKYLVSNFDLYCQNVNSDMYPPDEPVEFHAIAELYAEQFMERQKIELAEIFEVDGYPKSKTDEDIINAINSREEIDKSKCMKIK